MPGKCICPDSHEPVNVKDGTLCFETFWGVEDLQGRTCVCKEKCIRAVFEALLVDEISEEDAAYPNILIGGDEIACLLNLEGDAAKLMGVVDGQAMVTQGTQEQIVWRSRELQGIPVLKEVTLMVASLIMAIGDIHGRLGSLRQAFILWTSHGDDFDSRPYVVGLGDMLDRGHRQLEVFAAMVAWRAMIPHKVSFVRGNHETFQIASFYGFRCVQPGESAFDDFTDNTDLAQQRSTNFAYRDQRFFEAVINFFSLIPVALKVTQQTNAVANAVFMHGGFSELVLQRLQAAGGLVSSTDISKTEVDDIQWSEGPSEAPQAFGSELFIPSTRGIGSFHSKTATGQFLDLMGACILVTGHSHHSLVSELPTSPGSNGHESCLGQKHTHSIVLSAHNFNWWSGDNFAWYRGNEHWSHGKVVFIEKHQSEDIIVHLQNLFRLVTEDNLNEATGEYDTGYDAVPRLLDVGVVGGGYPVWPWCDYFQISYVPLDYVQVNGTKQQMMYNCHPGSSCPPPFN